MPAISWGWKTMQEQIVSSCALVLEEGKAEGDCLMDELKPEFNLLLISS
jgi:hypothetical protein